MSLARKRGRPRKMRFIDLFAGLGGFHLALSRLGHKCVFACEIEEYLRQVYFNNFGIEPSGDIRKVDISSEIPQHDILCAGFPCQPFSKAGAQNGFADPESGDLFSHIVRILRLHRPSYFILENVANFQKHNNGKTWEHAKSELEELGYSVDIKKLSPHYFGVPQIRERVIIVGSQNGLEHFEWPVPEKCRTSIMDVLDHNPNNARRISAQVERCLSVWQEFLDRCPKDTDILSPLWSMEFGADYPYEEITPYALGYESLIGYKGTHGKEISGETEEEILSCLPSYALTHEECFPSWKVDFIKRNREFYAENREWIDPWMQKLLDFPPSLQKLEWNCRGGKRDIYNYLVQIRASGVRVKRINNAPSLIAMNTTQVPIVTWEKRYMTPLECARLQSMEDLKQFPDSPARVHRALGNAVNVSVVERVAKALLR